MDSGRTGPSQTLVSECGSRSHTIEWKLHIHTSCMQVSHNVSFALPERETLCVCQRAVEQAVEGKMVNSCAVAGTKNHM